MTCSRWSSMVAVAAAGSLVFSSTGAIAANLPSSAPQQMQPWATMAVLSGTAPVSALCASQAVVAAAPGCVLPVVDQAPVAAPPPPPTPVPPVEPVGGGLGISPLWLALGAIAAGVLLYFLLRHHHHHAVSPG